MSTNPAPSGFKTLDEWILHQLFEQPKANHMTHTLFQQLQRVLESEPSRRDEINELRRLSGQSPVGAEEQVEERKLEFREVQYAVETLIESGKASGDRNSGVDGVYYTDLKLTRKGEAEAIRAKRGRADAAEAIASVSERLRDLPLDV
jgi:hypothetical protein